MTKQRKIQGQWCLGKCAGKALALSAEWHSPVLDGMEQKLRQKRVRSICHVSITLSCCQSSPQRQAQKLNYFLKQSDSDPLRWHLKDSNALKPEKKQSRFSELGTVLPKQLLLAWGCGFTRSSALIWRLLPLRGHPTHQLRPYCAPPTASLTQPKITEPSAGLTSWGYSWMRSKNDQVPVERAAELPVAWADGPCCPQSYRPRCRWQSTWVALWICPQWSLNAGLPLTRTHSISWCYLTLFLSFSA